MAKLINHHVPGDNQTRAALLAPYFVQMDELFRRAPGAERELLAHSWFADPVGDLNATWKGVGGVHLIKMLDSFVMEGAMCPGSTRIIGLAFMFHQTSPHS